jgi:transposase
MFSQRISHKKIYLYQKPVDFRNQVYGLAQIVHAELKRNPAEELILVFQNRKKDKVKILMWDLNGFVLVYKVLEKGRFDFGLSRDGQLEIRYEELKMLLSGMPIVRLGASRNTIKFS